ncbi:GAF domain-containing protein [Rubripirellula reticaptiva]|uniref:Uncharacterized protein n=1 Tax=Rubripirellula reticaptiva TaxID=2528013 RepID=A0A5C6FAE2_9BACT|nr:GAF domain-containing protein [Rubripirellula reticaptiva]TWU57467.1 hypothetical protein Poly59_03740 [Rubripirellula reticaptiva]
MIAPPNLLSDSLLVDARTYKVDESRILNPDDSALCRLAVKSIVTGMAEVLTGDDQSDPVGAALAIPIYRNHAIISIAVLAIAPKSAGTGVFEIWEPVDPYEELRLRGGYFAQLERFSNVSSFVRFEKGNGLPGQVWSLAKSVIHDDLPNHVGFLRAAGASAGLLSTAIGIPVINQTLLSAVVMISSSSNPIAKAFEIWTVEEGRFVLDSSAYQSDGESGRIALGSTLSLGEGLPGLARQHEGAVTTDSTTALASGRVDGQPTFSGGLAIPFYVGNELNSVATLCF